jgi:hypothetical protein
MILNLKILHRQYFVTGLNNKLLEGDSRVRKRRKVCIRSMVLILNYLTYKKSYIKPDRLYKIITGKLVWSQI